MKLTLNAKPMEKWDTRFCKMAKFVSKWSKDPKAKVGAVLFSKRGGDISVGYNGFPFGVEDSAKRLRKKHKKLEFNRPRGTKRAHCSGLTNARVYNLRVGETDLRQMRRSDYPSRSISGRGVEPELRKKELEMGETWKIRRRDFQ